MTSNDTIRSMTNNFKITAITPTELRYYEAIDTVSKYEEIIKKKQFEEFNAPFRFIRCPRERDKVSIMRDDELLLQANRGIVTSLKTINNKHGSYASNAEIIHRNKFVGGERISGVCDVIECNEAAESVCNQCNRRLCSLHGPDHSRHGAGFYFKDAHITSTNQATVAGDAHVSVDIASATARSKRKTADSSTKLSVVSNAISDALGIQINKKSNKRNKVEVAANNEINEAMTPSDVILSDAIIDVAISDKDSVPKEFLCENAIKECHSLFYDECNFCHRAFCQPCVSPPCNHGCSELNTQLPLQNNVDALPEASLEPIVAEVIDIMMTHVQYALTVDADEASSHLMSLLFYEKYSNDIIFKAAKHMKNVNLVPVEELMRNRRTPKATLIKAVAAHCFKSN